MVGLVVMPTTWHSRRSLSSPPLVSRCRERSSSQIATPAEDSCASLSVIVNTPLSVARGTSRDLADAGQGSPCGRGNPVCGKPELVENHLVRRARPEVFEAHALAAVADEIVPGLRNAGLDADPRAHARGQN